MPDRRSNQADCKSLAEFSLFDSVNRDELTAVESNMRRTVHEAGEIVVHHLDNDDGVYFIMSGSLIASIISPEGREVAFDVMQPGDYFGEIAAIDQGSRSASVAALQPSEVALISGQHFRELVQKHPAISWALVNDLVARIRRLSCVP